MSSFGGSVIRNPKDDRVFADAKDSVVTIVSRDSAGIVLGFGTGFYVDSNRVVTSLHVIEPAARVEIQWPDKRRVEIAGLFGFDPTLDIAVLWTTNPPPAPVGLKIRQTPVAPTADVNLIGAPLNSAPELTVGTVLAVPDIGGAMTRQSLVLSAPARPGFSGGPVMDWNGEVVGVLAGVGVSRPDSTATKMSFAVPVVDLVPLLSADPLDFIAWRAANPAPPYPAIRELVEGELISLKNPEKALAYFDRAVLLAPNYKRAWVRKALVLANLGKHAAAVEAYKKVLELDPELDSARQMLALSLARLKRLDEADTVLKPMLSRHPRSVIGLASLMAIRLQQIDIKGALQAGHALTKADPTLAEGPFRMGMVWDLCGAIDRALVSYQAAAVLAPKHAATWRNIARLSMELGKDEVGKEAHSHLAGLPDGDAALPDGYVRLLLDLRFADPATARANFKRSCDAELLRMKKAGIPSELRKRVETFFSGDAGSAAFHRGVGGFLHRTGQTQFAILAYEQAAKIDPKDVESWLSLGMVCNLRWRYERANQAGEKVLELQSTNLPAQLVIGISQALAGRDRTARLLIEAYLSKGGTGSDAYMTLYAIETRSGNYPAAQQHLAKLWQINPTLAAELAKNPFAQIGDAAGIQSFKPVDP